MPNHVEEILQRYAEVARPEILRDHTPHSCIAATWITIETLSRLEIRAEPLEVTLSVGNAAYKRLIGESGRPPRSREELDEWSSDYGADVLGVGFDPPAPGGIGCHIVAVVDGSHLVDASIDQASEPSTGIVLPGVHIGRVGLDFLRGRLQRLDTDDLFIEYKRKTDARPWQDSYDWRSNPQTESAVARIERLLRAAEELEG